MESADEAARLDAKEDARATARQLRLAGVRPGMRVLDAGAGSGAASLALARKVGPTGQVVALERSRQRAAHAQAAARREGLGQVVSVVCGDLGRAPLPEGAFDLVFCRFVFEYLAQPAQALAELRRVARPGGRVVVVDLDGNGLFHHPVPPVVEQGLARLQGALQGRLDPLIGRKLFSLFKAEGLKDVKVAVSPHHLHAGRVSEAALENWRYKLKTLAPAGRAALGADGYAEFERAFLKVLTDEASLTYSVLFWVGGTKP